MKKTICFIILLFITLISYAIEITVVDFNKDPLADAGVAIIELATEGFTDSGGKILFSNIDPGEYTILVVLPGYEKLEKLIFIKTDNDKIVLQLNPIVIEVEETTIKEKRNKSEVTSQTTINQEDMDSSTQGVMNDVTNIVQSMPGVSSSGETFNSDMFIQGGSQDEWVARIDGVYIPNPTRWGGAITMFNPTFIESLDLYTAGYPAKLDQGLAGILDVTVKEGDTSGWNGFVDIGVASTEIMLQGPLGEDTSVFFDMRRTWYDFYMPLFLEEEDREGIQFPFLWDAVFKISHNITPQDSIHFLAYASYEGMTMEMEMDMDVLGEDEGKFDYEMLFSVASLRYLHSFNEKDYMETIFAVTPQFGQGDFTNSVIEGNHFGYGGTYIEAFQHFYINSIENHKLTLSAGGLSGYFDGSFSSWYYVADINNNWTKIDSGADYDGFIPLYGVVSIMDDFEILPGLILQLGVVGNGYLNNEEMNIQPRGGIKYEITPELDIFVRGGMYNFYPFDFTYMDEDYGNPDLQSSKAVHAIGGLDFSNEDYLFLVEGFYKYYYDLPMYDIELNYNNNGIRHTAGFDVYLQKKARKDSWINGWISYTFVYAAEMVTDRSPEAVGTEPYAEPVGEWYAPGYVSNHTLSAVIELTYRTNEVTPILNWLNGCKISLDFRLLSGKPYTPAESFNTHDLGGGVIRYSFNYGEYNSESTPLIYKLDIKVTMPFSIFTLLNLCGLNLESSTYVSLINVFNNNNVFGYYYNVDQSSNLVRKEMSDYPFTILAGMKVEF